MKYIIVLFFLVLITTSWHFALQQPIIGDNLGNAVLDTLECVINTKAHIPHISGSSTENINQFYCHVEEELRKTIPYEGNLDKQLLLFGRGLISHAYNTHIPWYWEYSCNKSDGYWRRHGPGFRTAMVSTCQSMKYEELDTAIHIRLGDVPFLHLYKSFSQYHFQYGKFYQWSFQRLGLRPGDHITIVYSIVWQSNQQIKELSQQFIDLFADWIIAQGYRVSLQSNDSLTDLASLVNAKRIIGSCGSFSFISAIGRDPTTFCLPQSGKEYENGRYELCSIPEWMSPHPPLLHHTVRKLDMDYTDMKSLTMLLFNE